MDARDPSCLNWYASEYSHHAYSYIPRNDYSTHYPESNSVASDLVEDPNVEHKDGELYRGYARVVYQVVNKQCKSNARLVGGRQLSNMLAQSNFYPPYSHSCKSPVEELGMNFS